MRESSEAASTEAVYELMRERLNELFGPGGSFRITLGRPTADDAVFTDTVATTVAWEVARAIAERGASASTADADASAARHESTHDPIAEHEELWRHIEEELLIRRTGPDSVAVDVDREAESASVASRIRSRDAA